METKRQKNKEYSQEIKDILEKEPAWIIRNGMWIIIGVITLMITGFFSFSKFIIR